MPLLSTVRKAAALSPPLPIANRTLASVGLTFRRSQFSLMAAAPGTGKSVFATNLALFTKVPTLFFSADSDEWTVRTRACAALTGQLLETVEKQLNEDNEFWDDFYAGQLRSTDHIDWCYQTDIDVEFIVHRLQAHAEMRGDYPHLIVVDNLGNTVVDQANEFPELRATCREMQRIARMTRAHVLALHHVVGPQEDGLKPVSLSDVQGKISKVPEMVLGLNRAGENQLNLSVPKNRGGKSGMNVSLGIDYATATIGGFSRG